MPARPSFPLWPDDAPLAIGTGELDVPRLTPYLPEPRPTAAAGVVICPGGGYVRLAMDHEGAQVAEFFTQLGLPAFVLQYRLGPRYRHPAMLLDAQRAIRLVRARAADYGVDPGRLGIMGFSAGGHLASTAATHTEPANPGAADPLDRPATRPDFLILGYPVVTFVERWAHRGSREALLGPDQHPDRTALLSNERHVNADTPPTFLFHTNADTSVPAENSVHFYLALRRAGVPAELHVYEHGRHGLGLARAEPGLASWPDRLAEWLRGRGLRDG